MESIPEMRLRDLDKARLLEWLETQEIDPHSFRDDDERKALETLKLSGDEWLFYDYEKYQELIRWSSGSVPTLSISSLRSACSRLMQLGWKMKRMGMDGSIVTTPAVDEKLKGLYKRAKTYDKTIDYYTEFKRRELPFFSPDELRPSRFNYANDDGDTFYYFGRTRFRALAETIDRMNTTTRRKLYLYGTLGSGKSHTMAAEAVRLVANGKRVVFIPDCRLLAVRPIPALRKTLALAFADDIPTLRRINKIDTEDHLKRFCDDLAGKVPIYFLIDQVNALDPTDQIGDRISNFQKEALRNLLDWITTGHIKIQSGTGNYGHGRGDMVREASEEIMPFFGGLDDKEMSSWWNEREYGRLWRDEIGEKGRLEVEKITGRLPLLLAEVAATKPESFATVESEDDEIGGNSAPEDEISKDSASTTSLAVVDSNSENCQNSKLKFLIEWIMKCERVEQIAHIIYAFSVEKRNSVKDTFLEYSYGNSIDLCLTNGEADASALSLLDHRFQYIENGIGKVSGGLCVSRCFAQILRATNASTFRGPRWFSSLRRDLSASVLGFLIENMCLSWIPTYGLEALAIPPACKVVNFPGDTPPLHLYEEALAIPERFNYPHVDAIYWKRSPLKSDAQPKIKIVGIQLTLQRWNTHSEAEVPFLAKAQGWVEGCSWIGEYGLAWLVEKRYQGDIKSETIKARIPTTHFSPHKGADLRLEFTRHIIEIKEFADRIGRKLAFARGEKYEPVPKVVRKSGRAVAKRVYKDVTTSEHSDREEIEEEKDLSDENISDYDDNDEKAPVSKKQRTNKAAPARGSAVKRKRGNRPT